MSIPVDKGDTRVFHFKTAPLREGEGQGSLECVHQALISPLHQVHWCVQAIYLRTFGSV